tara:strand:- start:12104 stop:12421 length:318 start_codon:yes stop_codon:yes gene_type:complete
MRKLLFLITTLVLTGCGIKNDNKIGYELDILDGIDKTCFDTAVDAFANNSDFEMFINPKLSNGKVIGYKMDIDGQSSNAVLSEFYQTANKLSQDFKNLLRQQCPF